MTVSDSSAVEKQNDLTIVLNGGSNEMLDATIPVKWFFSPEFIKKEPKYILLVDLNQSQLTSRNFGKRYVFSVDEAVAFIQTHRSGRHTMLALAFSDKKEAMFYLQSQGGVYQFEIDPGEIKQGKNWGSSLATTFVEFEVPKELFAQAPKSKLGKLWWKYLFWPNSPKAIDECQVRKLALFYALPKLPFFILAKVLLVLSYIMYALYHIIARPISLFFGYWPISWEETMRKIRYPQAYNWSINVKQGCYLGIYRKEKFTGKAMITSPFIFLLLFVSLSATIYFMSTMGQGFNFSFGFVSLACFSLFSYRSRILESLSEFGKNDSLAIFAISFVAFYSILSVVYLVFFELNDPLSFFLSAVGISVGLTFVILLIVLFFKENKGAIKRYFERKEKSTKIIAKIAREENRKAKEEKKRLEYQKYLQAFTNPEDSVTLQNLPSTFESNKLKRNARIKFWTTKTKVCRPYEN